MAKSLSGAESSRNGLAASVRRTGSNGGVRQTEPEITAPVEQEVEGEAAAVVAEELAQLRDENEQLRALCTELEQALQEATAQHGDPNYEDRIREFEALLEEKTETIRELHQQLQTAQATIGDLEAERNSKPRPAGPTPREEELLNLSEELERERRQLQEDEETLMQQMREMEMSMARERAEMARQRNDLQRVQSEVRHELERLERNGALQSKIDGLKSKLHDATARRGMANSAGAASGQQQARSPATPPPLTEAPKRDGGGLFGRLFGGGK
jgi:chromosome segregation ATPase